MHHPPAIRVGVVGVGWDAMMHVPAFGAVNGFRVVTLCSRRPESVAAARAFSEGAGRVELPDAT